jgi:hypothetical protein
MYVIETMLPDGSPGYLAPCPTGGVPAYTAHLHRAARFHTALRAADAARGVPPAYDPTVVKLNKRGPARSKP